MLKLQVSPSLGKKKQNRLSRGKLATSFSATELLSFDHYQNDYLGLMRNNDQIGNCYGKMISVEPELGLISKGPIRYYDLSWNTSVVPKHRSVLYCYKLHKSTDSAVLQALQ